MKRATLCLVLGLLGFGFFFASVAMAAPTQPLIGQEGDSTPFQVTVTPTVTTPPDITPTPPTTSTLPHPVASAMAEYFEVPFEEIEGLHQEGYGFGVIAHAYFIARTLDDGTMPIDLLNEFDSGKGWGVILKEHDLHPGRRGRGGNLGDVMSGQGQKTDSPGAAHVPPGQGKKDRDQPGGSLDTLSSGGGDNDDKGHGPPTTPPGQDKDKGPKGKKG
jgi:hypothetical protein